MSAAYFPPVARTGPVHGTIFVQHRGVAIPKQVLSTSLRGLPRQYMSEEHGCPALDLTLPFICCPWVDSELNFPPLKMRP
jgi:hypothetical protein